VLGAVGIVAWRARPLTGPRVAAHVFAFFLVLAAMVIGAVGLLFLPAEVIGSAGAAVGIALFLFLPVIAGGFVPMVATWILRRFAPDEANAMRSKRRRSSGEANS
jgi:hypothetical protein